MKIDQMHYNVRLEKDAIDGMSRADFETWEIDEYLNKAIWIFLKQRFGYDPTVKKGFETDQNRIAQLSTLHIKSPEVQPAITPIDLGNGIYELRLNALGRNIDGQYFRHLFLTDGYITAKKDNCTKTIPLTRSRTGSLETQYNDASWLWRRVLVNFGRSTFDNTHVLPGGSPQDPDTTANLVDVSTSRFNQDELTSIFLDTRNKYKEQQFTIREVYVSYIKYPNRVFYGGYDHVDGLSTATSPPIHCDIDEAFHDEIVRIAVGLMREDLQDSIGIQVSANRVALDKAV